MTLGLVGLVLAIVCTMHAKGAIQNLWEPWPAVTPEGWVVRAPPVPLPELDLIGFAAILLLTLVGGDERWRKQPGIVLAAGAAVALTSTALVARWTWQYDVLGTTSTLFFVMMAAAVAMLPLVADEVYVAAVGRERLARQRNEAPSGRTEWSGYLAGAGGLLVGLALLIVPIGMSSARAAKHGHLVGALVAAIGALSLARVARPVRWLNVGIGAWLVVAPLAFGYGVRGALYSMIAGLFLMVVSTVLAEPERKRTSQRIW